MVAAQSQALILSLRRAAASMTSPEKRGEGKKKKKRSAGLFYLVQKNLPVCKNKADTEPDTRQGKIISSHFLNLLFPSPCCVFYPLNHHMSEEMGGN